jgi:two-component system, cell cycle sensor histidine kinase and response regulator CckA
VSHTAPPRSGLDQPLQASDLPAVHAALLETIGDSVILTDLEGRIRSWNRGATAIFGYSADEMIGLTPAVLYPEDGPERLTPDLDRILAGEDFVGEWLGRRKDGRPVWVQIRTTAVRNAAGQPIGFLGLARDISQHKRSEEAIAEGHAQLELIANTAPAYIVQCDAERRYTFVNHAYAARFGLTPEQVVGKHIWEVVGENGYASLRHHIDAVMAGQRVEFEMEIPYDSIGPRHIHCAYGPYLGPDDTVQGLVAVITDIGERKRAEAALREQESLLRTILEALPVGVWVLSKDATLTYANPATRRIWGEAPLVPSANRGGYKAWWPDGRPLLPEQNPILEVLRDGVTQLNLEFEIETFDGQRKSILAANVPLRDAAGEIIGAISINVDVTQHRQAEAALREANARLTLAQGAAGLTIWEWEPETGMTSYTPEFTTLYGLPPGSPPLTYEQWREHVHPDDRDRVEEDLNAALAGERTYDTEYRVIWPDRSVHWIASRGQMLPDVPGRPRRMIGVNFDVNRRREAEIQLRQLDRLDTVARLAGGVAHEANNQMTVVSGAAGFILRRDDLPEAVREDAEHIRQAAERTATITQQLLAFSRRQILQPRVLDLNAAIRAFEAIIRRTMGEDTRLQLDLTPELSRVRIDEGQLQQVLINLTLNARDAMASGGTLTLETRRLTLEGAAADAHGVRIRPGRYVELTVRDTGVGMDPKTLAHIFDPFFTTKGVGQGTGLGLSTVYGIVKQSDGYVFAESTPGVGTSLRILLPVVTEPLSPQQRRAAEPGGKGETVLVVDDEPVVRAMMVRTLRETGYTVLDAKDGPAALALARGHAGPIHLLVTDLAMPGVRGRELARAVAELQPGLRVLFVSGFPGDELERRGLLEAGRPFLSKPFAPELLAAQVRQMLVM